MLRLPAQPSPTDQADWFPQNLEFAGIVDWSLRVAGGPAAIAG